MEIVREWEIWRQDDLGNEFRVDRFDREGIARDRLSELERGGHKQTYSLRPGAKAHVEIGLASPDDAAGIARVQVETWHATYRSIIPDAFLEAFTVEARVPKWRSILTRPEHGKDEFTLVARVGATVVGFASGGPNRETVPEYPHEVLAVYLLPSHQRLGIGKLLIHEVLSMLAKRGAAGVLVWVLAANPGARAFYEALGASPVREKTVALGGADLLHLGYGWNLSTSWD